MCGAWWKWRGERERVYENGVEGAWGGCGVVCKWNGSTVYCAMVFKCECEGVWNVRVHVYLVVLNLHEDMLVV